MVKIWPLTFMCLLSAPVEATTDISKFDLSPRICLVEQNKSCETKVSVNWVSNKVLCLIRKAETEQPIICQQDVINYQFPLHFSHAVTFQLIDQSSKQVLAEQTINILFNANEELSRRRLSWSLF
ncbi:DUF3019 domain-containing protein [Psychrosphaera aquimarina]|uniref:DUF3019 domain-containing protein n=1 Tax=Psychrosphaera aquimarina TaxID=2044854 RepID=A0ABU3QWS8_9GAMM|nr:DUF3019 domain-containing protein [Psychrosphaera aquimarina]MDU0111877.1 DUF3019 domain-containing protein [Psychrosphaera aquimarina]